MGAHSSISKLASKMGAHSSRPFQEGEGHRLESGRRSGLLEVRPGPTVDCRDFKSKASTVIMEF